MSQGVVLYGGNGRMGRMLAELIAADPCWHLAAVVGRTQPAPQALAAAVVIDFSLPEALPGVIALCRQHGLPLVSGTTGLSAEQRAALESLSCVVPVLWSANFSLGIAVLGKLAALAERWLGPDFDLHLHEAHHRHKRDAPSGTALALGQRIRAVGGREPSYTSLRGGSIIGEHSVHWSGLGESLILSHRADDRTVFARGALTAAARLIGCAPGWYELGELCFAEP